VKTRAVLFKEGRIPEAAALPHRCATITHSASSSPGRFAFFHRGTLVKLRSRFRFLRAAAFWIGVLLLVLDIVGLFTSLRSDVIYVRPRQKPWGPVPPATVVLAQINSYDGDKKSYVQHLTRDISVGIRHYWLDEGIDEYHLRVPIQENYLLWLASFVRPDRYLKYEFSDYRKAVERGVGMCSQCVVIVAEVMKEKRIHSRIVSFGEHVVVMAEVAPDEWWVLDPDYGVTIPYSLSDIQTNPELVRKSYEDAGWAPQPIQNLMRIYGHDLPTIYHGDGAKTYHAKLWIAEKLCYIMIWVIPALLMLPQVIFTCARGRGRAVHSELSAA
jgi:hypothetical protein